MSSLLIVLTCILIIVVIILADSLTTAMLIVSLMANFLVISSQFGKLHKGSLGIGIDEWGAPPAALQSDTTNIPEIDPTPHDPAEDAQSAIYGPFYEMWDAYRAVDGIMDKPQIHALNGLCDGGYDMDSANAHIAQQRSRDKRALDGWAVKDANYYRHHYGGELAAEENKPWWSRNEY